MLNFPFLKVVFCALLGTAWIAGALAQADYPSKPVRLIVPFAAGGPTDAIGRLLASEYQAKLGQSFVVENRPGATGMTGLEQVLKGSADGYSLSIIANTTTNNYHHQGRNFDFTKDVALIGQIYSTYTVVAVNPNAPGMTAVQTLPQLIAHAKANPGKLDFTSSGAGSAAHMAIEKVKMQFGLKMEHINYKGQGPALVDVLAGRVPIMGATFASMPLIESGKLRAIVVGSPKRSALLPEVATFIENGVPELISGAWVGVASAPGTPAPIVNRLAQELGSALARPEFAKRVRGAVGVDPEFLGPVDFAANAKRDFDYWGRVIREAGIKVEQ